jgi:hypothetical protein
MYLQSCRKLWHTTAVTVNDASGAPIAGTITSGVVVSYDWTNNPGGRAGGIDASIL